MDASLITLGAQAPDAALTLNRVALGGSASPFFFANITFALRFEPVDCLRQISPHRSVAQLAQVHSCLHRTNPLCV